MTLANKIIILVAFIVLSSAMVFYWFTQRLFQQVDNFHHSMATQRQYMEEKYAAGIEELQRKREKLSQDVSAHLSHIENELDKNQEKAEDFDREFLKGQNEVFDAVDNFGAGKK